MSLTRWATMAVRTTLTVAVMAFGFASTAHALALRTFVSGTGDDANPCSKTLPCRTLGVAFAATTGGGEIYVVDSAGLGGAFTITRAVKIIASDVAGLNVASGTTGITITAGASDVVLLRNIRVTGNGATNTTGIQVNSGRLVLQDSIVEGLSVGLSVSHSKADATNTDFINNTKGIVTTGTGNDNNCFPGATNGDTMVRLAGGNVSDNGTGYFMHDPGTNASCFRVTVAVSSPNNVYSINQTGNGTLVSGDGASCSGMNACQNITTYISGINQQGP